MEVVVVGNCTLEDQSHVQVVSVPISEKEICLESPSGHFFEKVKSSAILWGGSKGDESWILWYQFHK